ncbi:D-lactate dehydrogenase [Sulfuracidifex tepidarius]|uniref:D-lactate dehydrogenase n=3 Tax=Sulfuracidifex tepidarius TaxID=1294262 RepID=A0A510DYK5_9CREN|nr:D-lactate dehydrogenase [Sulfuracidifex tepidarius]BBG27821.1 D-lactate dehydrogenase [Sulfuracidifex tepidarius]
MKTGVSFSTDPEVVAEKSSDLTRMSPELSHLSGKADLVAFPKSEEDVVKVVEVALEEHVPLVPRGAGRNNIGGVIPMKGGIILDMGGMTYHHEDEKRFMTQPGVKYFDEGMTFNARIYPSTFRDGVTIGGNFEGGCGGIGAFRYNRVWWQAESVRMVNPKGKVVSLTADDVKVAAHAEGTTGIVTEISLLKKEWANDVPVTLKFESIDDAVKFSLDAYDEYYPIYHMTLRSPRASTSMEGETGVASSGWFVIISLPEGETLEVPKKAQVVHDEGRLWERRDLFFGGIIWFFWRRLGQVFYLTRDIQVENLHELLVNVSSMSTVQVEFLRGGIAHPFLITTDSSSFNAVKKVMYSFPGRNFDLHDVKINGRLDRDHLQKIITYKKAYDKEDLFNPGKLSF